MRPSVSLPVHVPDVVHLQRQLSRACGRCLTDCYTEMVVEYGQPQHAQVGQKQQSNLKVETSALVQGWFRAGSGLSIWTRFESLFVLLFVPAMGERPDIPALMRGLRSQEVVRWQCPNVDPVRAADAGCLTQNTAQNAGAMLGFHACQSEEHREAIAAQQEGLIEPLTRHLESGLVSLRPPPRPMLWPTGRCPPRRLRGGGSLPGTRVRGGRHRGKLEASTLYHPEKSAAQLGAHPPRASPFYLPTGRCPSPVSPRGCPHRPLRSPRAGLHGAAIRYLFKGLIHNTVSCCRAG